MKTASFVSQMLVLVVVALVASVATVKANTNLFAALTSNGCQSSLDLMETWNEKRWKALQMVLCEPRLPLPQKKVETPPVHPKPQAMISTSKLFLTKTNIAEEAQEARLAGMLTKPKRSLWNGVSEKSYTDGNSKLRIFGFRAEAWPSWVQIQYHDLGSVKDDRRTPPCISIMGAASFDFR